jgi:predicted RNase H-like nuclease
MNDKIDLGKLQMPVEYIVHTGRNIISLNDILGGAIFHLNQMTHRGDSRVPDIPLFDDKGIKLSMFHCFPH